MPSLDDLARGLERISARNRRVEADKAWETSFLRRSLIAVLTYFVLVVFFATAGLPRPFLNALVPAVAFLLSTLTLSFAKRWWLRRRPP